jgi:hypothetical protein
VQLGRFLGRVAAHHRQAGGSAAGVHVAHQPADELHLAPPRVVVSGHALRFTDSGPQVLGELDLS